MSSIVEFLEDKWHFWCCDLSPSPEPMPYLLLHQTCPNLSGLPAERRQVFDEFEEAEQAAWDLAAGHFDAGAEPCRDFADSLLDHFGLTNALVPFDGAVPVEWLLESPVMQRKATTTTLKEEWDEMAALEEELDEWSQETGVLGSPCWIIKHIVNKEDDDGEWCGALGPAYCFDADTVSPEMRDDFHDAAKTCLPESQDTEDKCRFLDEEQSPAF